MVYYDREVEMWYHAGEYYHDIPGRFESEFVYIDYSDFFGWWQGAYVDNVSCLSVQDGLWSVDLGSTFLDRFYSPFLSHKGIRLRLVVDGGNVRVDNITINFDGEFDGYFGEYEGWFVLKEDGEDVMLEDDLMEIISGQVVRVLEEPEFLHGLVMARNTILEEMGE